MTPSRAVFPLILILLTTAAAPAAAQCILANPSFEVGGSGGAVFGGWNQFGVVGSASDAHHGQVAARVSGPNWGGWDVSGYWQAMDCDPGEQWDVSGVVRNPSSNPLTGSCAALANVEWRDAGGNLIDYQSVGVASPSSPVDEWIPFSYTSPAAPAGTVEARIMVGVLQGPTDTSPDVHFDSITFASTGPPSHDDIQWTDFPSTRTIDFAGRTWRVKGPGTYGPGPNYFSHGDLYSWADAEGLHLTVTLQGSTWVCTEVVLEEALGYGDYVFTTKGRLDLLDPNVVFGLFTWEYGPCWDYGYLWWNPYNEFDIEFSRWGDPGADIAQFVCQPWDWGGNRSRFDAVFAVDEIVSTAFRWLPDRIECRSWRGGPGDEATSAQIHAWTYTGPHIPRPEQPRIHLNLWKLPDVAPAGDQEVVIHDFTFVPMGVSTGVEDGSGDGPIGAPSGRLRGASPNPFNPMTTVAFELMRPGVVTLEVVDALGRTVATLHDGPLAAGRHDATWDGRGLDGRRVASGSYLLVLRGDGFVESRTVSLIK